MKTFYECIVIGGGVAGAAAAYHLAGRGYHTAVLEKSQGPHDKVCGEFLSFEAVAFLKEMGVAVGEEAPQIKHFQLFSRHSKTGFTFPVPARGLSRYKLDEDLLRNADGAGAEIFRGVCMLAYRRAERGLFRVETSAGDFTARHVFIATGKYDHAKGHKRRGRDDSFLGLKCHVSSRPLYRQFKETTALFTFPGGYGGICPVEGERLNFCFVIDKRRYKSLGGDFEEAVDFLRRSNRQLNALLGLSEFTGPVCAVGHIPYGYLRPEGRDKNVYFVGDQRAVIPSFTGDGMAIALSTAKNCVLEFDSRQGHGRPKFRAAPGRLRGQMRWALWAHAVLKSSWAAEIYTALPGLSALLARAVFQKTRVR